MTQDRHPPTDEARTPVQSLREGRERLFQAFLEGRDGGRFLERHTELLDEYFRESYFRSRVGPHLHAEKNPFAIVALGGYGRREQCLRSDVDLLLLFRKRVPDGAEELVREIVYPLWDIGVEVGHATRSLKECRQLAGDDFEVLTSLLDARFLCGFSSLYGELTQLLRDRLLRKRSRAFLHWLLERTRRRHEQFGDSTYLLEPDIKEGHGGLRDYHALGWMALATYRTRDLEELARDGHITQGELEALQQALAMIWKVRNRLHHMTGRRCDRLYFEYQVEMARALGFRDRSGRQGVERCLGVLHGHMEFLKQVHRAFAIQAAPRRLVPFLAGSTSRLRTRGLRHAQGTLSFQGPEALAENPVLLVRIFEQSAQLGVPLSVDARRHVRENLRLVDRPYRASRPVVRSLRRVVAAPAPPLSALAEMLPTGLLTALLPALRGLVNLIQYDDYHLYPVDKHSLRTLQALQGLGRAEPGGPDDLPGRLFRELRDPEPLLWAAFLHDAGKGAGTRDHAERGARIARRIATRLEFPPEDADRVSFLVREHLSLMKTATHRDLQEEKTVVQFARKFRCPEELSMLYLLTVADARATGPKAWNSWIDTLLKELFFKTRNLLEKGEELAAAAAARSVERKKREVRRRADGTPPDELEALFDILPPRYLLYTPARDMAEHLALFRRLGDRPCVLEHRETRPDLRTVTVCACDRPGLFSKIAGVFTLNNLGIHEANITTWGNGAAMDIFTVQAPPDPLREEETWARVERDLARALNGELCLEAAVDRKMKQLPAPARRPGGRPDKITVDNRESDFFTIVEVATRDVPGLLYRITRAIHLCGLDVRRAKIATHVDQVLDVFYVRDLLGQKLDDPGQVENLRELILGVLSGPA